MKPEIFFCGGGEKINSYFSHIEFETSRRRCQRILERKGQEDGIKFESQIKNAFYNDKRVEMYMGILRLKCYMRLSILELFLLSDN